MDDHEVLARGQRYDELFQKANAAMFVPRSTSDESGLVTLETDESNDFVRVRIGIDWKARGGVAAISRAVADAYRALGIQIQMDWATALAEADRDDKRRSAFVRTPAPRSERADFRAPSGAAVDALVNRLTENFDTLDRLQREGVEPGVMPEIEDVIGTARSGPVEARYSGTGDLLEVLIDEEWAERSTPVRMGEAVREAVVDGLRIGREREPVTNPYQDLGAEFQQTRTMAASLARQAGLSPGGASST